MDKWIAECSPCKWEEKHDAEGDAIAAAEAHVIGNHISVPSHTRALQKMGHVQQRTIDATQQESAPAAAGLLLPTGEESATPETEKQE